jgi:quinol monooxygenase YgiN
MVIVTGVFECAADERDRFVASRLDRMRSSRAESGCLDYTFSADPLEPTRVLLFERWESQEALNAHLAAMAGEPPTPPADTTVTPTSMSITMYDAVNERGLGG